jgi:hypothetical protein
MTRLSGQRQGGYNTAMWRIVVRWLIPILFAAVCLAPAYTQSTQQPTEKKNDLPELRRLEDHPSTPGPTTPSTSAKVPVFEYLLAIAGTLLVLIIVCTPSRKG